MAQELIISLILLLIALLDAVGDGCRDRGFQQARHSIEALQIGIWLTLCILIGRDLITFDWIYAVIYTLGRTWAFDYPNNLIAGRKIGYVGKSSLDGKIYHWITSLFKNGVEHTSFIFKFVALVSWIGLIIKMIR